MTGSNIYWWSSMCSPDVSGFHLCKIKPARLYYALWRKGPPRKVRSDAGKEFLAKQIQSYFKSVNIKHFVTQGESKSNYVERVIKTIRSLMHRFMKQARSFRYIDSLQTLVSNYNKTPHSSLGNKAPIEINEENEVDQIASQYLMLKTKKSPKESF